MGENDNVPTTVTSHGQTGGITAHNVTFNGGVQPPTTPAPPKKPWWKTTWKIAIGGATIAAFIVAALTYFHIQPKEKGMPNDNTVNVTSLNQSGGITAGTVYIGSVDRSLSNPVFDPLKSQMLANIPRAKSVTVTAVLGDSESFRFAAEIHAFLKANGFTMAENGISQAVFMPPPRGVSMDDKSVGVNIVIGSK
jgi:hypothetical protein